MSQTSTPYNVFVFSPALQEWERLTKVSKYVVRLRDEIVELRDANDSSIGQHQLVSAIVDETADVLHFILAMGMELGVPYYSAMQTGVNRTVYARDLGLLVKPFDAFLDSVHLFSSVAAKGASDLDEVYYTQQRCISSLFTFALSRGVTPRVVTNWLHSKVSLRNRFGKDKVAERFIRNAQIISAYPEITTWFL